MVVKIFLQVVGIIQEL